MFDLFLNTQRCLDSNRILCLYHQGMFFPQLFGIVGEKLVYTKEHQYDDPEDLYDDKYLLEVRIQSHHAVHLQSISVLLTL